MLRLKVEWHNTCTNCGVELVIDAEADSNGYRICPWCGKVEENELPLQEHGTRTYISETTKQLENYINNRVKLKRM